VAVSAFRSAFRRFDQRVHETLALQDRDEAAALEHSGGMVSRAAELLGMGRTTLWRKLKAYGIATGSDA